MMKSRYIILLLSVCSFNFFTACASKPLIDKDDIKLTRDEPSKDCHSMGAIEVRSITTKVDEEKLMEDLKSEARKKGANFVKVEGLGAHGSSMRGQAYHCH